MEMEVIVYFLLNKKDENYNQITERFIDQHNEPFIVQKFFGYKKWR